MFSILHVASDLDPVKGGVSQSIRTMVAGLKGLGIHNEVISLDNADADYIRKDDFIVNAVGKGKGPWRYNRAYGQWLFGNLGRFDAVIVHGLWLYHGYAAKKAVRLFRRLPISENSKSPKLFIMPHGMLDPYFQLAEGRWLKAIRNRAYWSLVEGKIINGSDGLLFTCQQEMQLARQSFKRFRPKMELVVGLGVDEPPCYTAEMTERFLEQCSGYPVGGYFLFIGRIHEKKGVDLLIKAYIEYIEMAVRNTPAVDAGNISFPMLIVAGPGLETDYGQGLQKLVKNNPEVADKILFPGMLTGEAKWGAFYGCGAFILPSHQENFGIAVVEALACGKPVLISDRVNIWHEIKDARAGFIATDTFAGTLSLLNEWIAATSSSKLELASNARRCFEMNFGNSTASNKLLCMLQS